MSVDPLIARAHRLLGELRDAIADTDAGPIRAAAIADYETAADHYQACAYAHCVKRAAHGLGRLTTPPAPQGASSYQTGVVEVDGRDTGEGIGRYR